MKIKRLFWDSFTSQAVEEIFIDLDNGKTITIKIGDDAEILIKKLIKIQNEGK